MRPAGSVHAPCAVAPWLIALAAVLLVACATPPAQYPEVLSSDDFRPRAVELKEVPFFPQEAYQCGPAALATVMNHAGKPVTPQELEPRVYLPERQGSLQAELLAASRREGLIAYTHAPELRDLLGEVAAGNPVLVMQNLGLARVPVWHYAVVVGFDLDDNTMILRSGIVERETMSFRRFERTWRLAERWALTVHAPGDFPESAAEHDYLQAVAALEGIGQLAAAERGFAAAVQRWPENHTGWIGLGNSRYRAGRFAAAEEAYRAAAAAAPENPAAHHNLAWALIRQGRRDEAYPAAERATELAGEGQDHYRGALEELRHTPVDATTD